MTIMQRLREVLRDSKGATAIEYGMILAMIVLAMMAALNGFAGENTKIWNTMSNKVNGAVLGTTSG